jgi:hypothetical protein
MKTHVVIKKPVNIALAVEKCPTKSIKDSLTAAFSWF